MCYDLFQTIAIIFQFRREAAAVVTESGSGNNGDDDQDPEGYIRTTATDYDNHYNYII